MLLAIDVGNTRIKAGVFEGDKLRNKLYINEIHELSQLSEDKISSAAVSSVVPEKINPLRNLLRERFRIEPLVITTSSQFNLKINYSTIETLGIDRLCSAEGAFYLAKNSNEFDDFPNSTFLITIDFGTASTINVVEPPGIFTGGMISPGIELMLKALHSSTAQLPNVSIDDYESFIGNSTKSSIASGVINSLIGLIERMVNHLTTERNAKKVKIFITGGGARTVSKFLRLEHLYEENLVLIGIKEIYRLNKYLSKRV